MTMCFGEVWTFSLCLYERHYSHPEYGNKDWYEKSYHWPWGGVMTTLGTP